MAGSAAAAAAGAAIVPDAGADTVQITLGRTATNVNGGLPTSNISPDVTGDGKVDILGAGAYGFRYNGPSSAYSNQLKFTSAVGTPARASFVDPVSGLPYFVAAVGAFVQSGLTPQSNSQLISINFNDKRINNGALTNGWLEINARNISTTTMEITLVRVIFDDASTVAPGGVAVGMQETEWVNPIPAQRRKIVKQIRQKTKALRRAARAGKVSAVRRLKKQIRVLKNKLRKLC